MRNLHLKERNNKKSSKKAQGIGEYLSISGNTEKGKAEIEGTEAKILIAIKLAVK